LDAAGGKDGDGTVGNGDFDVRIEYADRNLPDLGAPLQTSRGDGAAAWPWPWPNCPPFIPVDVGGQRDYSGMGTDQIPADRGVPGTPVNDSGLSYNDAGVAYDDAGNALYAFAADGGACASYGWLGSTVLDKCLTMNAGSPGSDFIELPPCNGCSGGAVATSGPRAGTPKYDLCLELYQCMMRTGCATADRTLSISYCLCGDAGSACLQPNGPCGAEELAGLEYLPTDVKIAQRNLAKIVPDVGFTGVCSAQLNQVFLNATNYGCFQPSPTH
jgi:hypothetical protein